MNSDARGAFLQVLGLVNNQYGVPVAEVLDYEVPYVVAGFVGLPAGQAEKVLHAGRTGVTGVLGDRPAVLSRQVRAYGRRRTGCPLSEGRSTQHDQGHGGHGEDHRRSRALAVADA